MEKIIRNVRDIDGADRQVLEHVIGQRLRENQQIIVNVVNIDVSPKPSEQGKSDSEQEIPDWWKVYEGLNDEDIDRLDEAVRQRANLTRVFE
jgi:hypothetical protein